MLKNKKKKEKKTYQLFWTASISPPGSCKFPPLISRAFVIVLVLHYLYYSTYTLY